MNVNSFIGGQRLGWILSNADRLTVSFLFSVDIDIY
jgi:hypothetical protein